MTTKEFKMQLALGTLTYDIKKELADNKRTSKEILIILSTDEVWYIRCRVADNSNTSKEVLTKLSKDKNSNVRYWIAYNPNTPKEIRGAILQKLE